MATPRAKRAKRTKQPPEDRIEDPDWSSLPSELYIRAFDLLPFEDLLRAMLVCKKWHALLQLPVFSKRISLAIEYCIISPKCPPWSVLIKSKRKFLNLRFGECFKNYSQGKDATLWRHLGKHVESMVIRMEGKYVGLDDNVLLNFPKLKHLSIPWEDLMMFTIPTHVQSICVKGVIQRAVSPADAVKFGNLKKHLRMLSTKRVFLHWNDVQKGDVPILESSIYGHIEHLRSNYAFQLRLPVTLNLLALDDIGPEHVIANYESDMDIIDLFPNLKRISLAFRTSGCYFVHRKLDLDKVQTVEIDTQGQLAVHWCLECLDFLRKSCPNFNGWKLVGKERIWKLQSFIDSAPKPLKKLVLDLKFDINDIYFNFPELEKLKITGTTELVFINCANWPMLPKLKRLTITGQDGKELMFHSLPALAQKCPNVIIAKFDMLSTDQIIKLEEYWPQLQKLKIYNTFDEASTRSLVNRLQGKFQALRTLGYSYSNHQHNYKPTKQEAKIFEKIPTLRESLVMNYNKYCLYQYQVPKIFHFREEFQQRSDDEENEPYLF